MEYQKSSAFRRRIISSVIAVPLAVSCGRGGDSTVDRTSSASSTTTVDVGEFQCIVRCPVTIRVPGGSPRPTMTLRVRKYMSSSAVAVVNLEASPNARPVVEFYAVCNGIQLGALRGETSDGRVTLSARVSTSAPLRCQGTVNQERYRFEVDMSSISAPCVGFQPGEFRDCRFDAIAVPDWPSMAAIILTRTSR